MASNENRPSHHELKSLKQFRRITYLAIRLREFNARQTLPVYPVFEVEKSNEQSVK